MGRFSDEDQKILGEGFYNRVRTLEEGEDEKSAYTERGTGGLRHAVEFWKLSDNGKSREVKNILDNVFSEEIEGLGSLMRGEQVKRVSELLNELDEKLNEYFDNHREIRPEKLNYVKKTLPEYLITPKRTPTVNIQLFWSQCGHFMKLSDTSMSQLV